MAIDEYWGVVDPQWMVEWIIGNASGLKDRAMSSSNRSGVELGRKAEVVVVWNVGRGEGEL